MYTTEQIARVCHEANRALQIINGDVVNPGWDELDEDMRQGAIHGVRVVQEGNDPQELHRQWAMVREAQGWVYGPVKDPEKKTHPDLVPYDQLPPDQKIKDHLFHGIVTALDAKNLEGS